MMERANPFGEEPLPWYKDRPSGAPRWLTGVVGGISLIVGGKVGDAVGGHHTVLGGLVFAAVAFGPPSLVEWRWRRKAREKAEALLPEYLNASPPRA